MGEGVDVNYRLGFQEAKNNTVIDQVFRNLAS